MLMRKQLNENQKIRKVHLTVSKTLRETTTMLLIEIANFNFFTPVKAQVFYYMVMLLTYQEIKSDIHTNKTAAA